jgi:hypothetical protein
MATVQTVLRTILIAFFGLDDVLLSATLISTGNNM